MKSKWLKKQRQIYGLSQFSLSKLSGVSRFKISSFENGYMELSHAEKEKINEVIKKINQKELENENF